MQAEKKSGMLTSKKKPGVFSEKAGSFPGGLTKMKVRKGKKSEKGN